MGRRLGVCGQAYELTIYFTLADRGSLVDGKKFDFWFCEVFLTSIQYSNFRSTAPTKSL